MLMAVGNLYTVMKVGITFGVAISACVLSFAFWSVIRISSGGRLGQLSLLESSCMQTTASAAGYSTGTTLAAVFASLMILDPEHRQQPWWVVTAFCFTTATMGVLLAIPMKRLLINQEQLPFPSGTAAAATLRGLYSSGREAARTVTAMVTALVTGTVSGVLSTAEDQIAALGRFFSWMRNNLFDVHLPGQIPAQGFALLAGKPMVGFGFEPGVATIGFGMIIGVRVALSMLAAGLALHLVIAPWLQAVDASQAGVAGYVASIPAVGGGSMYFPLRWSLWGGASLLMFSSLTAMAVQWRTVVRAFTRMRRAPGVRRAADSAEQAITRIEVPGSWMVLGMIPIGLAMVALQVIAFHVAWWAGIIAVLLSFAIGIVVSRAAGETDIAPTGALGKVMQLVFAVIAPPAAVGPQWSVTQNIFSAGIANSSAIATSDLLTDLKTAYLLGAHPRRQFLAQLIGVGFGTLVCVPAWYLLVPNEAALERYPMPASQIWVATARALTGGLNHLPASILYAVIAGAVIGVLLPLMERSLPRIRAWLPSATGLGLGWVIPFSALLSLSIGAVIAWAWKKGAPENEDRFRTFVASGLIAGEAVIKALLAMLASALALGV
jgi:putative OPT family oligopeptide transporter